mgnify:FL=1
MVITLERSITYYEEKSEGLGAEFLDEVEHAIAQILTYPDYGTVLTDTDHRRILLNRFPFGIIYEVSEDLLTIYAVMHQRRNADYWKLRK